MATTYKTLDEARAGTDNAFFIIQIDHATERRCFIRSRVSINSLRRALSDRPMPEILTLITEHTVRTPEDIEAERAGIEAEREHNLRHNKRCDRCGAKLDGTTCYRQRETASFSGSIVPVTAYYCSGCEGTLKAIGQGEQSDMENRASDCPIVELSHKED